MRRANEAIIRERLPIPTVDEVLEELNGNTVFCKLDLRNGFHQIELHQDSRDITTFVTHAGLFRYKRLTFIPDFATEAEPLRVLCRQGEKFVWGKAQEEAFNTLKEDLAGASMLAFFDGGVRTQVIADASPVRLGAVFVQEVNGQSRAVCYASGSVSDTVRRYCQAVKEALAKGPLPKV